MRIHKQVFKTLTHKQRCSDCSKNGTPNIPFATCYAPAIGWVCDACSFNYITYKNNTCNPGDRTEKGIRNED
jgi:hypothetical protein